MNTRQFTTLIFVFLACQHARAESALPSPQELLTHYKSREEAVSNLSMVVKWEDFGVGVATGTEHQVLHYDSLGRLRILSKTHRPGREDTEDLKCYNGELFIDLKNDPNRDNMGAEKTDKSKGSNERWVGATINLGLGADGQGPFSHRNPCVIIERGVMDAIESLIKDGHKVGVSRVAGQHNVYQVEYHFPHDAGSPQFRHVAIIDGGKDWTVISHQGFSLDGSLLSRGSCELQRDAQGAWLPKSGRIEAWGKSKPTQPADLDWRFEVAEIKLNDPTFDESIFRVAFKPGTHVADNRYHVSYTIGDEGAIEEQLSKLAQQADAARTAAAPKFRETRPIRGAWVGYLLVTANIAVISAIVYLMWRKRVLS